MATTKGTLRRFVRPAIIVASALALGLGAAGYSGYRTWQLQQQAAEIGLTGLDLVTDSGEPFDPTMLLGRPTAIFFGFTHCPDVCPMTLYRLGLMRGKIGTSFDQLQVLFVTLDPERDTPEMLKDYMSGQPIKVTGVTGPDASISAAARKFDVFRERVAMPGQGYTVDHTASLFLLDRDGRRAGEISIDASEAEFEQKIRLVLSKIARAN